MSPGYPLKIGMPNVIEFDQVSKRFTLPHEHNRVRLSSWLERLRHRRDWTESFWALRDVSFGVGRGETIGLIGPNGSGKSTILKLIVRILHPTSGLVQANGRIAALLELGAGFHHELSGRDNVFLNASILGMSYREIDHILDDVVAFSELERFIDTPVKFYSSGMYARLAFSIAIHVQPDILLIDETLSVGDQAFQAKCMARIYDIKQRGTTILLVSHDLSTVQAMCDRAVWLESGRVQEIGNATDVVMAYLNRVAHRSEEAAAHLKGSGDNLTSANRWGSGRVQVTGVELCDLRGSPRSTFVTQGGMEIRIHYEAREAVDDPVFGIAIHHQNGAHICGPNTSFSGVRVPKLVGAGMVTYRIPSLALLEGPYAVSVAVHNRQDTEMYDYHDRAYPFRVYVGKSRERYGLVSMQGDWQLQTGADGEPSLNKAARLARVEPAGAPLIR